MGIPGLTSFILNNSDLYLKPHKLSDCHLVLDGANIAYMLCRMSTFWNKFGGDYDEYLAIVRDFMSSLKKCNIKPIFIFDGPSEVTKVKMRLNHRQSLLNNLKKCLNKPLLDVRCCPLFTVEVLLDVVREMKFNCIQCDFEADAEIAAVARSLKCPVLSFDSDFFIYDALYIPFKTVNLTPIKCSDSNKYYMECLLYDVHDFLNLVDLEKSMLPVLVTFLGNDHTENDLFCNVFKYLNLFNNEGYPDISKFIQWLKNQTLESVKRLIKPLLSPENFQTVLKMFHSNSNIYEAPLMSKGLLNELACNFEKTDFIVRDFCICWPKELSELYTQAWIPSFLVIMVLYQHYLTPMLVENIYDTSSHLKCLKLIKKIYAMLTPYLTDKKPLSLYLVQNGEYKCIQVEPDEIDINLERALKEPWEERLRLLLKIVDIPMDQLRFVPCNSWAVFVMSFVYWANKFKNLIRPVHVHAFVIMLIANQIVQTKVGYFKNITEFMRTYGAKCNELEGTELSLRKCSNFKEMLTSVTDDECLLAQSKLIPFRGTKELAKKKYCFSTIHLFNGFQTCLFYIMIINALLNHPLPHLRVADFYSGTLLFNVYLNIKSDRNVEQFGTVLFENTPNLNQIYKYLSKQLYKFL